LFCEIVEYYETELSSQYHRILFDIPEQFEGKRFANKFITERRDKSQIKKAIVSQLKWHLAEHPDHTEKTFLDQRTFIIEQIIPHICPSWYKPNHHNDLEKHTSLKLYLDVLHEVVTNSRFNHPKESPFPTDTYETLKFVIDKFKPMKAADWTYIILGMRECEYTISEATYFKFINEHYLTNKIATRIQQNANSETKKTEVYDIIIRATIPNQ
jgi:hypothetical protein